MEEEIATHSILAWEIPWTEEPSGVQSMGHKKSNTAEHTHTHTNYKYCFSSVTVYLVKQTQLEMKVHPVVT